MMKSEYLFVYGTLLPEFENGMSALLKEHGRFVAEGSFQGCLYEVANYPGAILSDNKQNRVFGGLFEISESEHLFDVLDGYEECGAKDPEPHLYQRAKILIECQDEQVISAWTYLYNMEVKDLFLIETGDYRKFRNLAG